MRNAFFGTKKDPHAEEPASAGVSKHAPPHSLGGALPAAWPRRRHFRSGLRAGHRPPGPGQPWRGDAVLRAGGEEGGAGGGRSEEHTSELQSLMRISYAVFCLKKKKTNNKDKTKH